MMLSVQCETWLPAALDAELIADDEVLPAFVTRIGEHGMALDSLAILGNRRGNCLQVRLELPGEPDPLWIAAEVVRDAQGLLFNELAIRFVEMASIHWRWLRRWIRVRELALRARRVGLHAA